MSPFFHGLSHLAMHVIAHPDHFIPDEFKKLSESGNRERLQLPFEEPKDISPAISFLVDSNGIIRPTREYSKWELIWHENTRNKPN